MIRYLPHFDMFIAYRQDIALMDDSSVYNVFKEINAGKTFERLSGIFCSHFCHICPVEIGIIRRMVKMIMGIQVRIS